MTCFQRATTTFFHNLMQNQTWKHLPEDIFFISVESHCTYENLPKT